MKATANKTLSLGIAAGVVVTLLMASSSLAFTTVSDAVGGVEDDLYASGRIINSSDATTVAHWSLSTTVSNTDFGNDSLTGGPKGLEYVMMNTATSSTHTNSIRYAVSPSTGFAVENISVLQSPYHDDDGTWNGGNSEASQFVISWAGGGFGMVTDPDDQVFAFSSGSPIVSGTTIRFDSFQTLNSEDSWRVDLPTGVSEVQVNWSSANPSATSDLTREWVTFDTTIAQVPEPAAIVMLGLAMLFGVRFMRRK